MTRSVPVRMNLVSRFESSRMVVSCPASVCENPKAPLDPILLQIPGHRGPATTRAPWSGMRRGDRRGGGGFVSSKDDRSPCFEPCRHRRSLHAAVSSRVVSDALLKEVRVNQGRLLLALWSFRGLFEVCKCAICKCGAPIAARRCVMAGQPGHDGESEC